MARSSQKEHDRSILLFGLKCTYPRCPSACPHLEALNDRCHHAVVVEGHGYDHHAKAPGRKPRQHVSPHSMARLAAFAVCWWAREWKTAADGHSRKAAVIQSDAWNRVFVACMDLIAQVDQLHKREDGLDV